jgi:hypothetical protein
MAGWLSKPSEHARVAALLSPYLDGQASEAERALVERHLASCAECAHDLASLKATVAAVHELPRVRAPRSFALPRSMARQPQASPWLVPALRAATALATLLFAVIVGGDVFLANSMQRAAAPAPAMLAFESSAQSAPTAAPEKSAKSAPQVLDAAASATAPAQEAGRAASATPGERPAPAGLGSGQPPAAAPLRSSAALTSSAELATAVPKLAAAMPVPTATLPATDIAKPTAAATRAPEPTVVARVPEPVPPASSRGSTPAQVAPQINSLRIAEGALALLAIAFGVTAWLVNRRSR